MLTLTACVHEPAAPSAAAQPQPTPAPPQESEVQRLPPTVAAPELVTDPEPGTEAGARAFVASFMQARMARDDHRARTQLSAIARDQFEKGEGGLTLTGTTGSGFAGWELVSISSADASSFEARVKVREAPVRGRRGPAFEETLFVGPGPDVEGIQRPWVIRGALRGN